MPRRPRSDTAARSSIRVRPMAPRDFAAIERLSRRTYPDDEPWLPHHLQALHQAFPSGQLVAVDRRDGVVAASLILRWADHAPQAPYEAFTAHDTFETHDPRGRTLYGIEVMVDPARRRRGIGRRLYAARRRMAARHGLRRIHAGARLAGYHRHAHRLPPEAYVEAVVRGRLVDQTLSFQLRQGFRVLATVRHYLAHDPESHGHAALIAYRLPGSPTEAGEARAADPDA